MLQAYDALRVSFYIPLNSRYIEIYREEQVLKQFIANTALLSLPTPHSLETLLNPSFFQLTSALKTYYPKMTRLTIAVNFFSIALSTVLAAPTTAPIIERSEVIDIIFPHYLVPAMQNFPNTTYATQHTAQINYTGFDSDMSETTMFGK